ncbi:MAG: glycosyltransferase family 2 protein [Myxococcota bacterium]|nr:glycosyltransferase family 2 protein [Myxococcota bacterium]
MSWSFEARGLPGGSGGGGGNGDAPSSRTTNGRARVSERPPRGRRYLLVTPCRNEAKHLRTTLDTTLAQSVLPARWVIVDDGSTDETPQILAEYAAKHELLHVITRADRGVRAVGPGVIEAFYEGLATVDLDDYDYVCKYDADLQMPPRYFERAMERMEAEPHLGNISGKMQERQEDGSLVTFFMGDENAIGAIKFYRMECFRQIGGFVRELAWDGIDGHLCRMHGWIAMSVDDPELRFVHLRPMGSSQDDIIVGRRRWGRGKYYMGSAWYYVLAASVFRMKDRPVVKGGMNIFYGYLKTAWDGGHRYDNPRYRKYVRRFELMQLVLGKGRAARVVNARIRQRPPPAR